MVDNTTGKTWLVMTSAERQASAINNLQLAWKGPVAVAGAAQTLTFVPSIRIATSVPGIAGYYDYNTASFGPVVSPPMALGTLADIATGDPAGQGCTPFSPADTTAVAGK